MEVYELVPGNDFQIIPADGGSPEIDGIGDSAGVVEAWVMGRSMVDPNDDTKGFDGPAMDVAAYTTYVYCKP
jgi:hypothetical protein